MKSAKNFQQPNEKPFSSSKCQELLKVQAPHSSRQTRLFCTFVFLYSNLTLTHLLCCFATQMCGFYEILTQLFWSKWHSSNSTFFPGCTFLRSPVFCPKSQSWQSFAVEWLNSFQLFTRPPPNATEWQLAAQLHWFPFDQRQKKDGTQFGLLLLFTAWPIENPAMNDSWKL